MICPMCETSYSPKQKHQRFCSQKCKADWHNREKTTGIRLPECFRADTQSYADGWGCTLVEAASRIYASGLKWTEQGRPLTDNDIWGTE